MYYDWRDRQIATKSGVETSESTSVNRPIGIKIGRESTIVGCPAAQITSSTSHGMRVLRVMTRK